MLKPVPEVERPTYKSIFSKFFGNWFIFPLFHPKNLWSNIFQGAPDTASIQRHAVKAASTSISYAHHAKHRVMLGRVSFLMLDVLAPFKMFCGVTRQPPARRISIHGRSREYYHCTVDLLFDWFGLVCFANKNKKTVGSHIADSKPVKQEVNSTVLLPPLVFPGRIKVS